MKNIILLMFTVFCLGACTERIEIELDDTYTRLVVEGLITADTTAHMVKLTKTTSYFYSEPAPTVSGAEVSISDGDTTFWLTESEPGVYKTDTSVFGVTGKTYALNIFLNEPINEHTTYEASCALRPVAPIDSITVTLEERWDLEYYEIHLWAWEPEGVDYYMFNYMINDVLITDTINEAMVTDDLLYSGSYTNGIGVGWLNQDYEDQKVKPGDTIALIMSGITEEYCNFLWALDEESGDNDPLFSGPPSNVVGNINHGALGFFAAYANISSSTIVK